MYRKEKDPLKPKQPMSAFFVFANARRAALVAENKSAVEVVEETLVLISWLFANNNPSLITKIGTISSAQVAKITGEEWKNMTEKQKKPYEKVCLLIFDFSTEKPIFSLHVKLF